MKKLKILSLRSIQKLNFKMFLFDGEQLKITQRKKKKRNSLNSLLQLYKYLHENYKHFMYKSCSYVK